MTDYAYLYSCAVNRYNGACSEISSAESRLGNLNRQRQEKNNLINQLETSIRNNQEAFDGVTEGVNQEGGLTERIGFVTNKIDDTSGNYKVMVSSSSVVNKSMEAAYSGKILSTKNEQSRFLETLRNNRNLLNSRIENLQNQLSRTRSELEGINNEIRGINNNLPDLRNARTRASWEVEYYRRKMNGG